MPKKKIGKIKITRKVTVTQQRHIQYKTNNSFTSSITPRTTSPQQINSQPQQKLEQSVKQLESAIKKIQRASTLPSGKYSPQVETLYEEFYKRSKSEDAEASALYDVFISHASEDKIDFVNPLVEELQNIGVRVWYDSLEMMWGKSLREQIDNGIKRSKFALIVLSKNFFSKKWPQRELDGILAKEEVTGSTPLPIWHNISYDEVYEFSPTLSGIYSLSTDKYTVADICKSLSLILQGDPVQ